MHLQIRTRVESSAPPSSARGFGCVQVTDAAAVQRVKAQLAQLDGSME